MSGEPLAAGASTARSPPASGIETTEAEACAVEADWCDAGALMGITVPRRVDRSMILYRLACAAVVLRCFESGPLRSCTFRIHRASPKRHKRRQRSFLQKARKLDVAYAACLREIVPQRAGVRKRDRAQRPVCASGTERSGPTCARSLSALSLYQLFSAREITVLSTSTEDNAVRFRSQPSPNS